MNRLDKRQIRHSFGRAAGTYDEAAALQRRMADKLAERLEGVARDPDRILDAGCGTGYAHSLLTRRYPRAEYIGNDIAPGMVREARRRTPGQWLCADIEQLPLQDCSVDLVFSNAMLQWCNLSRAFSEVYRILKPGGGFLFGTFGPGTLRELRAAWARVDAHVHVHEFVDAETLQKDLAAAGFQRPILEVRFHTVTHPTLMASLKDLKAIGANNADAGRARGLAARSKLRALEHAYAAGSGGVPTTYELIYGQTSKRP